LRNFTVEANRDKPFSRQTDVSNLKLKKQAIEFKKTQIASREKEKLVAVQAVLRAKAARRLQRLNSLLKQAEQTLADELSTASIEVGREFATEHEELRRSLSDIDAEIQELTRAEEAEKFIRQAAIDVNFSKLEAEIRDRATAGIEDLWTMSGNGDEARQALRRLPDISTFKDRVNPDHFFSLFDSTAKTLSLKEVRCSRCENVNVIVKAGQLFCQSCGRYFRADDAHKVLALPGLSEMLDNPQTASPKLESGIELARDIANLTVQASDPATAS
jgi:hypothetical protein